MPPTLTRPTIRPLTRAALDPTGHPHHERARVHPYPQLTGLADEIAVDLRGLGDVGCDDDLVRLPVLDAPAAPPVACRDPRGDGHPAEQALRGEAHHVEAPVVYGGVGHQREAAHEGAGVADDDHPRAAPQWWRAVD